ncbi:MAG: hypothetical protein V4525_05795 [Pseudomonadota bacterium]
MKYKLIEKSIRNLERGGLFVLRHKTQLGLLTTALLLTGCGRPFVVNEKIRLAPAIANREDWCAELPLMKCAI